MGWVEEFVQLVYDFKCKIQKTNFLAHEIFFIFQIFYTNSAFVFVNHYHIVTLQYRFFLYILVQ